MNTHAKIDAIAVHLPAETLSNEDLVSLGMSLKADDVFKKTGIASRSVVSNGETAVDLAERACKQLLDTSGFPKSDVDFLLVCTQSPDYPLPSCCSLLHDRLDLPKSTGALDINMGCSGFVYGLGVASGLLGTGQANNVILVTTDTYSRYLAPQDHSTRSLFGDGAAAVLVSSDPSSKSSIGPFVYGSDGSGADNLIVSTGCLHEVATTSSITMPHLKMNGPAIFTFALREVPPCMDKLLESAEITVDDVDHFVLHQANQYMLDHLFDKLDVPVEKRVIAMHDCGNTVSSSIPIALAKAIQCGEIKRDSRLVCIGFGVGLSWAGVVITGFDTSRVSVESYA